MPTARGFMKLLNPSVKIHHKLYIDRYFDAITLEKIKETLSPNENQEPPKENFSKISKMQIYNSTTKELLTKGENKLRLTYEEIKEKEIVN